MTKIVGIRFKPAGKVYDFESGAFVLQSGDHVIVETERGLGFGTVAAAPVESNDPPSKPLKKVYRMATDRDFNQLEQNNQMESRAYGLCKQFIAELGLQMNLFSVESTFDANKLTFFFTSENRVDFRQLVKLLVKRLGCRIEMRQVGIRNQAKMCGGLGRCGRELCCCTFMDKFGPVSIRMAKEQGLSLNPTKISGQCGRLMCCLTFEFNTYRAIKKDFPKIGKTVQTPDGRGKVIRHNAIQGSIAVRLASGPEAEFPVDTVHPPKPEPQESS